MKRRNLLLALLAVVAIIGIARYWPTDDATPLPEHHTVAVHAEAPEHIAELKWYPANDTAIVAGRNLFSYTEAPKPVQRIEHAPVVVTPPQPVTVAAAALPSQPVVPQPPRFAYRYIGRFGPDDAPLAAFANDGEVVVVRPGEKIGSEFVLRAIGVESAVIGFTNFANTLTVPIGQ